MAKKFGRKLTKLEKKQVNELKKKKSDALHTKKKVATTMDWCQIDTVSDDCIILKKGKSKYWVKGIKLHPHNIFMDDPATQARLIDKLRICLNKCPGEIFYSFVQNPVNVDDHLAELLDKDRQEDDLVVQNMIQADFEKTAWFQEQFKELEFFIMIRDHDPQNLEKRFLDLETEWRAAGFLPRLLNKRDYYNYIEYCFENPLINDYYFSRGMFSSLNQEYLLNEDNELVLQDDTEEFEDYGDPIVNFATSERIKKSRLVPTAFSQKSDHLLIGDKVVGCTLVTALPKTFQLGLLCDYVNNPKIKLFMRTDLLDMNLSMLLKRDYQEKMDEYRKTRDPSRKATLEAELQSLQAYIDETVRNNDRTWNVTIVFEIYADDLKELTSMRKDLKQHLNAHDFKVTHLKFMQESLYRYVNPLFVDCRLPSTIQENLGVPLPSDGVAGLYPYVFETLKDKKGFLFGYEMQNGGIILFNPFYYLDQVRESQVTQRVSGNSIVVGTTGAGKTTAMNLIIRWFIMNKIKLIWICPENKNRYLTRRYKGTFIELGQKGNIINIFDLKPSSSEEDDDESKMWDTELAIYNVIEDINQVLKLLYPQIDDDTLSLVGDIAIRAYAKVGICQNADGTWTPFKHLGYKDMPTFTDFNECILERIEEVKKEGSSGCELELLNDLKLKMVRILKEWSVYLNGHTSIHFEDEERQIISFGTKVLFNKTKELREAMYHILFQFAWSLCLNNSERTAFVQDEAHVTILEGTTAKLLSQFYRRARKYNTVMVMGTQEPRDFADDRVLTEGKAIFNNSVYKLIMKLELDAVNDVSKLVPLNDNERILIQAFQQGEGLFVAGNRRIPIKVLVTPTEKEEMGIRDNVSNG